MPRNVLVSAPYFLAEIDRFMPIFAANDIAIVRADVAERLEEEQLLDVIADIDGVICGDDRFTPRVLRAAPRLKVISKWGTGVDSIDAVSARELGIRICRTPNAFTEPVADTVLGYILCFARNLPFMDRHMKSGIWNKIPGRAMNESTIGVIGLGDIGKAVLRRARPFGARLLGCDINPPDSETAAALGVELRDLDALLRESDFVSLNCDLNETSRHLMNERTLFLMKPTAILVNTSRGPVVDEAALVRALTSNAIAGAALDVFEDEPLPSESPLLSMENVLVAPHNCNSSPTAWENVHASTVANLIRGLNEIRR